MATNERIQRNKNDLPYGQLAPSQANRESWYPGKANAQAGDATWDKHYRVPVGEPELESSGPLEVTRVRIEKLGRNIISDQTIAAPQNLGNTTVVIDDDSVWGTAVDPQHVLTETETQDVNGDQERTSGYDWAEGV